MFLRGVLVQPIQIHYGLFFLSRQDRRGIMASMGTDKDIGNTELGNPDWEERKIGIRLPDNGTPHLKHAY